MTVKTPPEIVVEDSTLVAAPTMSIKQYKDILAVMPAHSEMGGSVAKRYLKCSGSIVLGREASPQKSTFASEEGTEAHAVAESYGKAYLEYKKTGTRLPVVHHNDPEIVEAAKTYSKLIYNQMLGGSVASKWWNFEYKLLFSETYKMFGTADFCAVYLNERADRVGVITDFKYGRVHVPIKDNPQFIFYAIALMDFVRLQGKELVGVHTSVYQPKVDIDTMPEQYYTVKQLEAWRVKFLKVAKEVYVDKKPKFKVNDECRYCPAQDICPTYTKDLDNTSGALLTDLSVSKVAIDKVPDDVRIKIAMNSEKLKKFIDMTKESIKIDLQNGIEFDGIKLVQHSQGKRAWTEIKTTEEVGEVLLELGVKEPYRKSLRTISDVEKELKKLKLELPEELTPRGNPSLSIVGVKDPRPAITSAVALLEDVTTTEVLDDLEF